MLEAAIRIALTFALLALTTVSWAGRDGGGYFTAEKIANARANVQQHDWAAAERDAAVERAGRWVEISDDDLWHLVPCQDLPRTIDVTLTRTPEGIVRPGCLNCGDDVFEHGNYPYIVDPMNAPWTIKCPSCEMVFPTNDFGAFYESAIDERGCFDASLGDRSLLFNTDHPDPDDPLHTWGVDDGWGYVNQDGREFRFIGYYTWQHWRQIRRMLDHLAEAWVYTGDEIYARKAGILLDRIADVYPEMDWRPYAERGWYHSSGGSRMGKIEGRIWETGTIRGFALNYDRVADGLDESPALLEFLAEKARQYDLPGEKGSAEDLFRNIEEGILRVGAEAIMSDQIRGNEGMHQSAMAAIAMAFDRDPETGEWMDWIFAEDGGAIPGTIVGRIDRDGVGAEGAPSYSLGWIGSIANLADFIAEYDGYDTNDIYRDYPMFGRGFTAGWKLVVLGLGTPNIGDAGSTGSMGRIGVNPELMARGYRHLRDPEIAIAAWRANNHSAAGLQRRVYDEDPDAIAGEIERAGSEAGPAQPRGGFMRAGYGLSSLEVGHREAGTALWTYFGRNSGHGHRDRLNVGIYGFGLKLSPDLGYPEFATAWPKRREWTDNTISHNTVVVDARPQAANWAGQPAFFKTLDGVSGVEIRSENVYPQCDTYARTLAMVQVTDEIGYGFDVFRVRGGSDHLLSFHATPGDPQLAGLSPAAQAGGTYAGPDVPFGERQSDHVPLGFSWLYDVERDAAPGAQWSVDWHVPDGYRGASAADQLHLRYHHLSQVGEVALAHGDPPQNKPGNPRRLRYVLARTQGDEGLTSTFASIYEPYRQTPVIASVERIECGRDAEGFDAVAVRVELADGATDWLLSARGAEVIDVPGGPSFSARLAWLRLRDGEVERAALIAGTEVGLGDFRLTTDEPAFTGTVVRMDRDMEGEGRIWVDAELPADETLVGEWIAIENDDVRNAFYEIRRVERDGELTMLSLGDLSFVREFIDRSDYAKGYVYNFEEGAGFTIPHHAAVTLRASNTAEVRTTGQATVEFKEGR
ncbi:MAG: heparinase II/III domain-containing protein [Armatimonadota bacterium]|jgi:hypothetical protein